MRMKLKLSLLICLITCSALSPLDFCRADKLILKDGKEIEGIISWEGKDYLIIVPAGGASTRVYKSSISKIIRETAANPQDIRKVDELVYLPLGKYKRKLLELFPKAKKSIYVVIYYIKIGKFESHPVNSLVDGLVEAQQRGVDVKVLLDSSYKEGVLKENQKTGNYLKKRGIDAKLYGGKHIMHTKLVIIDDEITLLGSHNWTAWALEGSYESSVMIKSKPIASRFKSYALNLFRRGKPITGK